MQSQKLCHRFKFHLLVKRHGSYFSVDKDKHKAGGHILKWVSLLHKTFYKNDDIQATLINTLILIYLLCLFANKLCV